MEDWNITTIVIKYSGIDLGQSWAKIYGSSVGWLENTSTSTQPFYYSYWKKSKYHKYHSMSFGGVGVRK